MRLGALLVVDCMFPRTRREIVETMVLSYAQRIFAGQRPVFDGRKNLYSKEPLPIGRDRVSYHCRLAETG